MKKLLGRPYDFLSGSRTANPAQRSPWIDLLRILCCFYVAFCHVVPWFCDAREAPSSAALGLQWINDYITYFFQPFYETNVGVMIFIILSGYCSHRTGFRTSEKIAFLPYYRKKIIRVFPVFIFATLLGIALWFFSANPVLSQRLTATTAISPWGVAVKALSLNVWLPSLHTLSFLGNAPLITICVEIWLYILYPLVVYATQACRKPWLPYAVMAGSFVFSLLCILCFPQYNGWLQNGSVLGFSLFWWIGAMLSSDSVYQALRKHTWKGIAGYALLSALLLFARKAGTTAGGWLVLAECRKVFFAFLIGMLVHYHETVTQLPAVLSTLAGWGKRYTYPIYAVHGPLSILLLGLTVKLPLSVVFLLCFVAGVLTYWLVEKPFAGCMRTARLGSRRSGI